LAAPLEADDLLSPTSPTLLLDALSPGKKSNDSPSPAPYRPANLNLLNLVETRSGWRSMSLRLVRPLWAGANEWAQVWVADVEQRGHLLGRVVLKLLVEALFWEPDEMSPWIPAGQSMTAELKAYAALCPVQGQDVPHCYGAFRFSMPWGETAPGIILEDLTNTATPSWGFLRDQRNELTVQSIDSFMCAAHVLLHRLQGLGVAEFDIEALDLLLVNPPSLPEPTFVLVDFGQAVDARSFRDQHEANIKKYDLFWKPWQSHADYKLQNHIEAACGEVVVNWREYERKQRRGIFADPGWYEAKGADDD
ncbi:hypothetical protein JCM11641_004198, partial [Rhodosporidiobolus odoratus]